jgi:hypothetical protein
MTDTRTTAEHIAGYLSQDAIPVIVDALRMSVMVGSDDPDELEPVNIILTVEPEVDPNHLYALGQALIAVAKGMGA